MCRSGCAQPGTHASWGECARAASIQVGPVDPNSRKRWDAGLEGYRNARKIGLQPEKPTFTAVEQAKRAAGA